MNGHFKTQYNALDLGKFVCALLILFYHYFSEHGPVPRLLDEALSLYAVGVALFMVISGFLAFGKISVLDNYNDRRKYIFKQIRRILLIYLFWSIPYIFYQIAAWDYSSLTFEYVLAQLQRWIFGSTFYTIWFMPSLALGLCLAFCVTEKLPKILQYILPVLMYVLGSLMLTYSFLGQQIPCYETFFLFISKWLGGARGWLFFGFPLVMLGKSMVNLKIKMNFLFCALLSCTSVFTMLAEALILRHFVGHTGIDMTIMMVPSVFFILGALINLKLPNSNCFIWMRKMSVLIFVTQRIFLTVIPSLLSDKCNDTIFSNVWIGAVWICGGTVLFSAIVILLSKRIKWMRYLY